MKNSRFNVFFTYKDGTILGYNTQTRGLIELTKRDHEAYLKLSEGKNPEFLGEKELEDFINELARGKFLVPEHADELAQLKASYNITRFLGRSAGLTIVVTHKCNLACTYCYEERQPFSLTQEHIPSILELVEGMIHEARAKRFNISWYGGEPLLETEFISTLSERIELLCEKEDVNYKAHLVTNGTLLTRQVAQMLKEHKVVTAQLTLDGPPGVHDKRRCYQNGKGSFAEIINNIKQVHDLISIRIRVNVDIGNVNTAEEVLDYLESEGLKNKVSVYFAPVAAYTEKCASIEHECYSRKDFSAIEVSLMEKTMERGFAIDKSACLPRTTVIGCGLVGMFSMVIDAKGLIHKCWNTVGDENEAFSRLSMTGNEKKKVKLSDAASEKDNLSKWLAFDPFYFDKCRNCSLLPSCMGGCPWKVIGMGMQEPECPPWKHNIKERLWLYRECLNMEEGKKR